MSCSMFKHLIFHFSFSLRMRATMANRVKDDDEARIPDDGWCTVEAIIGWLQFSVSASLFHFYISFDMPPKRLTMIVPQLSHVSVSNFHCHFGTRCGICQTMENFAPKKRKPKLSALSNWLSNACISLAKWNQRQTKQWAIVALFLQHPIPSPFVAREFVCAYLSQCNTTCAAPLKVPVIFV